MGRGRAALAHLRSADTGDVHGLIQHSFALRLDDDHLPFEGQDIEGLVIERFALPVRGSAGFEVERVATRPALGSISELAQHSPLVHQGLSTVAPEGISILERGSDDYLLPLPKAFEWAANPTDERCRQRFVFAHREDDGQVSSKDFFVKESKPHQEDQAWKISTTLAQLLAHRRSSLFGIGLAKRFVNVMLPNALLAPAGGHGSSWHRCSCERRREPRGCKPGHWIMQPLVSLIRVGRDGGTFRQMYSLTIFLIPVDGRGYGQRAMPRCEIRKVVNAGWGLASAPRFDELGRFTVSGPLMRYVDRLDPHARRRLQATSGVPAESGEAAEEWPQVTLRQASEALMFAVALRMACGSRGHADVRARRRIGDNVVTSLGNSRVSSVMAVDRRFKGESLDARGGAAFPGTLDALMEDISDARIADRRKQRLDRPFFDQEDYAIGVLPSGSCMIVAADLAKQKGRLESGLTHAAWVAYMAIGAATATGTIRSIYRRLERMDLPEPKAVADIERAVVVDLNEIYDLDITWEAYRYRYRRLRDQLGITSDYKALHDTLQALYRETAARFDARTQRRLFWLTLAIVVASVVLVVVGVVQLSRGR